MRNASGFDLRHLASLFLRQIRIILLAVGLIIAITILWLSTTTSLYTASALVIVNPGSSDLLDSADPIRSSNTENARVASEVEILRSSSLALAVVQRADLLSLPEFQPQPSLLRRMGASLGLIPTSDVTPSVLLRQAVARYQNALEIRRRGLTYLIEISFTSQDPDDAARIANITAETYLNLQTSNKIDTALAARDILEERLGQANAELVEAERALDQFLEINVSRLSSVSGNDEIEFLADDLDGLRERTSELSDEIRGLGTARDNLDWDNFVARAQNDILSELQAQRRDIQSELLDATGEQGTALRQELDILETMLVERSEALLEDRRDALSSLESEETTARNALRNSIRSANLPPEILTEVFSIQQRAALARTQYQTLLSRLQDFETQAGLQVADARIVADALRPNGASFPQTGLILVLALIMGAGVGIGIAVLREFYFGGFTSETQISDVLNLSSPGSIPRINQANDTITADTVISAPLSLYSESLRRLRASIDQKYYLRNENSDVSSSRVIVVASTLPSEGKTTTALGLARTYATSECRTLLIDCDLRKPSIADALDLEVRTGLLNELDNPEAFNLQRVMAFDTKTDLEIIPSRGRSTKPTDQLLTSSRFRELIDVARKEYDVIIIDTPPLLPVVDARYLVRYADNVVLVIKWAETRQQDVRQSLGILRESGMNDAHIVAILNQQTGQKSRKYYQGYYGYTDLAT